MCSTDPFQFRWLKRYICCSFYHHHQIGSINLSQLLSYFSVVVCLLHHVFLRIAYTFRENWHFVLIIIVQFMMSANSRIRYGLQIVFVCLYITPSHYHHCANLSVDIELMKLLPDIFCKILSKIEHTLLVIHYSTYGAVCFQFTRCPCDGWENILLCLIIIIKSEVWTIIHCLGSLQWYALYVSLYSYIVKLFGNMSVFNFVCLNVKLWNFGYMQVVCSDHPIWSLQVKFGGQ